MQKRTAPKTEIKEQRIKGDCRNCKHASPVVNFMVECPFFAPNKVATGIHYCPHYKLK